MTPQQWKDRAVAYHAAAHYLSTEWTTDAAVRDQGNGVAEHLRSMALCCERNAAHIEEADGTPTADQAAELAELNSQFCDADFDRLEHELKIRAAALGWTGDPMKQPTETVLAVARQVLASKSA